MEGNQIVLPLINIEKQKLLREAEDEYKEILKEMEADENLTVEDVETFKKNALVQKSIMEVKRRA
jgi:hypothetical protein